MKIKMFLSLLATILSFAFNPQVKASNTATTKYVTHVTADFSLHLVTDVKRDPTAYAPGYGTNVRVKTFSDGDGFYDFTPRAGSTGVPFFAYSPYAMCDGKVFKVVGYYYNCDYSPCRMYVYLSVVISGTTYYMYWPAYRQNSSTDYTNFLEAA